MKEIIEDPKCRVCGEALYLASDGENAIVLACKNLHVNIPCITTISASPDSMSIVTVKIEPKEQ